jgi:Tfp pilus assembly protein PilV
MRLFYANQRQPFTSSDRQSGVTLTEVLIASAMTVLLMTAVFGILDSSIKGYNIQTAQVDATSDAQNALARMERELRQAEKPFQLIYSYPGNYESLVFKADLDDDGVSEAVMYHYDSVSRTVRRRVNLTGDLVFSSEPGAQLAAYVSNSGEQPIFTYFGTDLTTPLDPHNPTANINNNTRVVRVRLILDKDTAKPPAAIDLGSDIKLRNFDY